MHFKYFIHKKLRQIPYFARVHKSAIKSFYIESIYNRKRRILSQFCFVQISSKNKSEILKSVRYPLYEITHILIIAFITNRQYSKFKSPKFRSQSTTKFCDVQRIFHMMLNVIFLQTKPLTKFELYNLKQTILMDIYVPTYYGIFCFI